MVTTLRDDLDRLSNAAESALNQAIQASAPLANLAALDEEKACCTCVQDDIRPPPRITCSAQCLQQSGLGPCPHAM